MMAFPSVGWAETNGPDADFRAAKTAAPFAAQWCQLSTPVHHVYAFRIGNDNYYAETDQPLTAANTGWWQVPQPDQPSLMRKVWEQVEKSKLIRAKRKKRLNSRRRFRAG